MEKKRVKTRNGKKDKDCKSKNTLAVDRISKLPDLVIYHILSFVPTVDAIRMSLLSRRWRRMWYSVPTLQFSDSDGFQQPKAFSGFVQQCLAHRQIAKRYIADSAVTSFKLSVTCYPDVAASLDSMLNLSVILYHVRELDLCVKLSGGSGEFYCVPRAVLTGSSLTHMKLSGYLKIDDSRFVNLPSLKYLCLTDVWIEDKALFDLVIRCPSLEKLVINNIPVDEPRISSLSLKFLEFEAEYQVYEVSVKARNLQSLRLYDGGWCTRVSFSACRAIKHLVLSDMCNLNDQNFDDQISKLTLLENLTLKICKVFRHIKISNPSLKYFTLIKLYQQKLKVTTETPNLVLFCYKGDARFSLSMETPNPQLNGKMKFYSTLGDRYSRKWYMKLITFLSNINCVWNTVNLCVDNDEDLIVPKFLRTTCDPPWPDLKHLKVTIHGNLTRKSELRKTLHWLSPSLETLSIERRSTWPYSCNWKSQHFCT